MPMMIGRVIDRVHAALQAREREGLRVPPALSEVGLRCVDHKVEKRA